MRYKQGESEIWKDIPGWIGLYRVSTEGRVKSMSKVVESHGRKRYLRDIYLRPGTDKDGYLSVQLSVGGKQKNLRVHRLVAMTFLPNVNEYPMVNHKDSNPQNNCVWNLEWCTHTMNMRHMINEGRKNVTNRKISVDDIPLIKSLYANSNMTMEKISKLFNVTRPVIGYIINNKTYQSCSTN